MKTRLYFQTYMPGTKRPDDITLRDRPIELDGGACVPQVGDIIHEEVCSLTKDKGKILPFRVIGRAFSYGHEEGSQGDETAYCEVMVFVTPAKGDEIGVDIKR